MAIGAGNSAAVAAAQTTIAAGTTLTITKPAIASLGGAIRAGDLVVLWVRIGANETISVTTGAGGATWNVASPQLAWDASTKRSAVWWKILNATDISNANLGTVSWTSSVYGIEVAVAYRGVSGLEAIADKASDTSATGHTTPALTHASRARIVTVGSGTANQGVSTPAGWATDYNVGGTYGTGVASSATDLDAGTSAAESLTMTSATRAVFHRMALTTDTAGTIIAGIASPLRYSMIGPFLAASGRYYAVGRAETAPTTTVGVSRSNTSGGQWVQAVSTAVTIAATLEAIAVVQVGDVLHIAFQNSGGLISYRQFSMATNAFLGTTEVVVGTIAFLAPPAGYTALSLAARSDGSLVLAYAYGGHATMSAIQRVAYRTRSAAGTWSAATVYDNQGSSNMMSPTAVLGSSDRVHLFMRDNTAASGPQYQRALTSAGALESFPATFGNTTTGGTVHTIGPGEGGTTVSVPVGHSGSAAGDVVSFTSADAPSPLTVSAASDNTVADVNGQRAHALALDGTTQRYVYSDATTQDLYRDSDTGTGWGTDVEDWDVATINLVSANVYTRSLVTYLAVIVDDGGTMKHAEIEPGAAPPPAAEPQIVQQVQPFIYY